MPLQLDNLDLHYLINNVNLIHNNSLREHVTSILRNDNLYKNYYKNIESIKTNISFKFDDIKQSSSFDDQDCPICCHALSNKKSLVSCPDCKNPIHKKCMETWLAKSKICVFCRSSKWLHYV